MSETREVADPDPAYEAAMARAGGFLARRPHSEAELRRKLDLDDEVLADRVMGRLFELRLVDDAAFAAQWVSERRARKGRRALKAELEARGVDPEAIADALSIGEAGESSRAIDLAARHLSKVAGKPLERQAASIMALLLRRGFEEEVAEAATRAVLPPEGWD